MKSFVIYITSFFIIVSFIRAQFGIHDSNLKFAKVPDPKEKLAKKDNNSSKFAKIKYIKPAHKQKPKKLEKPEPTIELASFFGTSLQPIEQKYLKYGLKQYLAKRWYTKDPKREKYSLSIEVRKRDIVNKRYLVTYKGKRHFRLYNKSKIKIYYRVYNEKGTLILKGLIPYNVIVKSGSFWDYIESERLAKKKLFTRIGQKVANELNRKYYYILNYSNIAKL